MWINYGLDKNDEKASLANRILVCVSMVVGVVGARKLFPDWMRVYIDV